MLLPSLRLIWEGNVTFDWFWEPRRLKVSTRQASDSQSSGVTYPQSQPQYQDVEFDVRQRRPSSHFDDPTAQESGRNTVGADPYTNSQFINKEKQQKKRGRGNWKWRFVVMSCPQLHGSAEQCCSSRQPSWDIRYPSEKAQLVTCFGILVHVETGGGSKPVPVTQIVSQYYFPFGKKCSVARWKRCEKCRIEKKKRKK